MSDNHNDDYVIDICQLFDKDSDGCIYVCDILDLVKALGVMLTDENAKLIQDFEGECESEKVQIKDFIGLYEKLAANQKSKEEEEKELTAAFDFFDSENKGYIDADYFKKAITSFGNKLTEEEVNELLSNAPFDKTNKKFKFKGDFIKTILGNK